MDILIVGMGFVGSNAARKFVDEGLTVAAVDPRPRLLDYVEEVRNKIRLVNTDVTDLRKLREVVFSEKPRVVVHTAISPLASNFYETFHVNVAGAANVLEVAREYDLRVVYLSSGTVYGQLGKGGAITEEEPFGPAFPPREYDSVWAPLYCTSKRIGEQLVALVRSAYGVKATVLRLGWIYGRGDSNLNAGVSLLLRMALSMRPLILPYGADTYCPLVHVSDVADAILAAATNDEVKNLAFNIAYEKGYWMREVAEVVEGTIPGSTIRLGPGLWPSKGVTIPRGAISWPTTRPIDISRANAELGYRPLYDLSKGVREYAEWMKRNWNHCSIKAVPLPGEA